jgi:hypothetical protein
MNREIVMKAAIEKHHVIYEGKSIRINIRPLSRNLKSQENME